MLFLMEGRVRMETASKFRKFMIFFILSGTVAIAYQIPYLRFTFYDQMMAALSLDDVQMGFLATALTLTSTICYPIGGYFAGRFSLKNLICITLAAHVVLTIAFGFTSNYYLLIAIQILYGFFGIATLWSAYLTGIRGLADEKSQGKIFGSSEATRGIVNTICGFIFLGIVNVAATPVLGWQGVMLVGAALCGVFLILALIFLPKKEEQKTEQKEEKVKVIDVLKNKGVWITILLIMCAYVSFSLSNNYLTTYSVRVLGIDEGTATIIGIVRSYIIVFLAGFIGGWLLDKFTYKGKGFFLGFSILIVLFAGVILTEKTMVLCLALTLCIAFIVSIFKSTYWSVMGQAGIPLKMTAAASGIISFIAYAPDFILPPICGTWIDNAAAAGNIASGFYNIFFVCIAFAVAGIVISLILVRQTKSLEAKDIEMQKGKIDSKLKTELENI